MNRKLTGSLVLFLALALSGCANPTQDHDAHGHSHDSDGEHGHTDHGSEAAARGPHGGRLLSHGNFTIELSIFETGVEPHFRAYATLDGNPLPPKQVDLEVALQRINGLSGGRVDTHEFSVENDYLRGTSTVGEPHSFNVRVVAKYQGKTYEWNYDSPEDQVEIAASMARSSNLRVESVVAAAIRETLSLTGRIEPNAERVRMVRARYPGTVKTIAIDTGSKVKAGQLLATIESDESLQTYAIIAPIGGTVVKRAINPGESSGADVLFEIIDSKTLWANLAAFPSARAKLKQGQIVDIVATDGATRIRGTVSLISVVATGPTSSVRVVIDNADSRWATGQFVDAEVTVDERPAAITVPITSIQTMRGNEVVFLVDGERYQAQPVTTGRRDSERVEVLSGLTLGAQVVTQNSFLIKADIEKSGAAHDH